MIIIECLIFNELGNNQKTESVLKSSTRITRHIHLFSQDSKQVKLFMIDFLWSEFKFGDILANGIRLRLPKKLKTVYVSCYLLYYLLYYFFTSLRSHEIQWLQMVVLAHFQLKRLISTLYLKKERKTRQQKGFVYTTIARPQIP